MDFDEDVASLMRRMDATLLRMQSELLPLLASLNEDVLVTNYSVDEQARISLAAAFALVLLTYSHDRLRNAAGKAGMDARVQLKLERVSGYIKKLREITQLDSQQQEGTATTTAAATAKAARKRGREEAEGDNAEPRAATDASAVDDPYGDAILFTGIERGAGKAVPSLMQNLLRHVKESSSA
ncbi:exosome-associated protein 3 [Trypanosoma conorhini]|uniref:Exosome-associated protein 3 n=1 Tax=Trypanosoma conorhini TaxID=83891 RepID=A0A422PPH6_9TRYP|nr:exosome-associated protein 3 [Trypanosoma conorhini]RNF19630.1 exosome-associated protein 3 [Trypanosoma conorhini]